MKSTASAVSYGEVTWTPQAQRGPAEPSRTTPKLELGQMRRTSTVDTVRPEGLDGPRLIRGTSRDVLAGAGGLEVMAGAELVCGADPDGRVVTFEVNGRLIEGLAGALVGVGFRNRAQKQFPDERAASTPLWTLLDDLPTATMVSNYIRLHSGFQPPWVTTGSAPKVNICAGWRDDGSLIQDSLRLGSQIVTPGPLAPDLSEGWHQTSLLPRNGGRRRRRVDVIPGADVIRLEGMFRDATAAADRGEDLVVHEYGVRAEIDARTLTVLSAQAEPRVLPYVECPTAAASATRIVGLKLTELRDFVRADLVGVSTCTHLNDLLRCLEDASGLLAERDGRHV